jgi:hypothetical protein
VNVWATTDSCVVTLMTSEQSLKSMRQAQSQHDISADTAGQPHASAVSTAEVVVRNGALAAMDRCEPNLRL